MRHTDPLVSYGAYSDLTLLDLPGIVGRLPIDERIEVRRSGADDTPIAGNQ